VAIPHRLHPPATDLGSEQRAKSGPPKPQRLMADVDAALVQKILDVAPRQREPDVHHHRQPDDPGGCLEVAKGSAICHPATLSGRLIELNKLSSDNAHAVVRRPRSDGHD
jgi:hypothetical protein